MGHALECQKNKNKNKSWSNSSSFKKNKQPFHSWCNVVRVEVASKNIMGVGENGAKAWVILKYSHALPRNKLRRRHLWGHYTKMCPSSLWVSLDFE